MLSFTLLVRSRGREVVESLKRTLESLIDSGGRLLIFQFFSDPPELIRTPPFINFEEFFSDQDVFTPGFVYFQYILRKKQVFGTSVIHVCLISFIYWLYQ